MQGWTNLNDLVIELGFGSGSLAIVCMALGRNYIGFEQDSLQVAQVCFRVNEFNLKAKKLPLYDSPIDVDSLTLAIERVCNSELPETSESTKVTPEKQPVSAKCVVCSLDLVEPISSCSNCKAAAHENCLEQKLCDKRACRASVGLQSSAVDPEDEEIAQDDPAFSQNFSQQEVVRET